MKATRQPQAFVDGEAVIHIGVVDKALPAHGGAGFFKIHTHHDEQTLGVFLGLGLQQTGVFQGLFAVVDGARPHHHNQAVVVPVQHLRNGGAAAFDQFLRGFGRGQPFFQDGRGNQRAHGFDAHILDAGLILGLVGVLAHG